MKTSNLILKTSSASMFLERWFWSSNAKDIGTLYLMFALFFGDNQLYNSIVISLDNMTIFFYNHANDN